MKALFALPLLLACGTALADDAAVLHCRALSESGARLACYDAMPVGARPPAPAPASGAGPAPAPLAAAPAATAEQRFGLESVKPAEPETPKYIDTTIPGDFDGWGPTTQFTFANGQVWRVVDGSDAALPRMHDPKVRIVRNVFGTTFLEIAGTNNSPKVRRVR